MGQFHSIGRNHLIPQTSGRKSIVYLAKRSNKKVVIFVHGFNGNPVKTWGGFHGLFLEKNKIQGYDIIFYNYDSKHIQAPFSGIALHDFICDLISDPNYFRGTFTEKNYTRPQAFKYDEVILVAHSFGAIICRWALNRSHKLQSGWHLFSKMILFAPAHRGAIAVKPVMELFYSTPLAFLASIKYFYTPTINDVDMTLRNCSLFDLISDTEKIRLDAQNVFPVAQKILWAELEYVVHNLIFVDDPDGHPLYGQTHTNLCKPNEQFMDPIDHIIKFL